MRTMDFTSLRSGSSQDIGVTSIQHGHRRTVIKLSAGSTELNLSRICQQMQQPSEFLKQDLFAGQALQLEILVCGKV